MTITRLDTSVECMHSCEGSRELLGYNRCRPAAESAPGRNRGTKASRASERVRLCRDGLRVDFEKTSLVHQIESRARG